MTTLGNRPNQIGYFRRSLNAPAAPPAGGGGGAAFPPALAAPGMAGGGGASPFRQSLDRQREKEATSAATFAKAAPLPADATTGRYTGSYGSADEARAARAAFVGRQENDANYFSGGRIREDQLVDQEQARADAINASEADFNFGQGDLARAQGADLGLKGKLLYPAQAALSGSEGDLNRARAGGIATEGQIAQFMAPGMLAGLNAGTRMANANAAGVEAGNPFIPEQRRQQIAAGNAAVGQAQAQTGLTNAQAGLVRGQAVAVAHPQLAAPMSPVDALGAEEKMLKMAQQEAEPEYLAQSGVFGTGIGRDWFASNKSRQQIAGEKLGKLRDRITPKAPSTQGPSYPEGTRGEYEGRPVVFKGGKWVPA